MYKLLPLALLVIFVIFPDSVLAQTAGVDEAITSFGTRVQVQTDGSISVTETIQYQTALLEQKHGIYRDIRTTSSQGKEMSIQDIEVLDENGVDHPFEKSSQSTGIRLKIGNPNVTFSGAKTYVIKYRATHAVAYFDQFDEIYWNATGNDWPFPILSATAEVVLPNKTQANQTSCYQGGVGSQQACQRVGSQFVSGRVLSAGEGMTVAVGFNKGVVIEKFTLWERLLQLFEAASLFLGIGIFVWTAWSAYRRWYLYGRDPKERGVTVPEYDAPKNLTPLEASGLLSEAQVSQGAYIAQIISLAVRGYIRIHQDQEKYVFGLITTNDYQLERLAKNDGLKAFDELLLKTLFSGQQIVKLSSLKNSFYRKIPAISRAVMQSLKEEGYYSKIRGFNAKVSWQEHLPIIVAVFLFGMGFLLGSVYMIVGSVSAFLVWAIFGYFSPQKTERGVRTKEQLEGLKLYIEKAEKARIEFHDAPEKTPELFSSLLPFAMVLGLTKIWLKEFEDLNYANPDWYVATGANHALIGSNFFHDFDNFSHAMTASTAAPGSSGSGSSGGGGGGGGGGSW